MSEVTPATSAAEGKAPSLIIEDPETPSVDAFLAKMNAKIAADAPATPAAAAEPEKPAAEAMLEPPTEPKPEPEAKPEPAAADVSDAFAKAAASNKRLRKEREAAKAAETAAKEKLAAGEAALKEREARVAEFEARLAAAKGDPAKSRAIVEQTLGTTYADETRWYLQQGKLTPEQKIEFLEKRLDEQAKALEERDRARTAKEEESAKRAGEAEYQRNLAAAHENIHAHVIANPERFEMLNALPDEIPGVWTVIETAFSRGIAHMGIAQGTRLTIDKASEMLENFLTDHYRPVTKVKKLGAAAAAVDDDKSQNGARARAPSAGLTNDKAASPAGSASDDYIEDKDVAIEALVRKLATRK